MNIEKEKRIEEILLSLKKCDFLTREQLQKCTDWVGIETHSGSLAIWLNM